jgi:hypothetical protein
VLQRNDVVAVAVPDPHRHLDLAEGKTPRACLDGVVLHDPRCSRSQAFAHRAQQRFAHRRVGQFGAVRSAHLLLELSHEPIGAAQSHPAYHAPQRQRQRSRPRGKRQRDPVDAAEAGAKAGDLGRASAGHDFGQRHTLGQRGGAGDRVLAPARVAHHGEALEAKAVGERRDVTGPVQQSSAADERRAAEAGSVHG